MTVDEVLRWLAGAGALAAVSWFASWFLEGFTWWDNLASKVKSIIILGLAIVLGLFATWMLSIPADVLKPYIPYLTAVVLIVTAWLGSQVAHRLDSKAK